MPCPSVEIVFIMDTSLSMEDEAAALCDNIVALESMLESQLNVEIATTLWGITVDGDPSDGDGDGDTQFWCLTSDVLDEFEKQGDVTIPGDNGGCSPTMLGQGNPSTQSENWGSATAVVAAGFPWTPDAVRIIIPISDEGPCLGGEGPASCNTSDMDAAGNAESIAMANDVVVSPIVGTPEEPLESCFFNTAYPDTPGELPGLVQELAIATGGQAFLSTDPAEDLVGSIVTIVTDACTNNRR